MLCYVMLCYVICYVMLCYVMLCYVMLLYALNGVNKKLLGEKRPFTLNIGAVRFSYIPEYGFFEILVT